MGVNKQIMLSLSQSSSNLPLTAMGFNFSGPDNLDNLRKLAEQFQKQQPPAAAQTTQEDDDDEVPELVAGETFETAAEDHHHTS